MSDRERETEDATGTLGEMSHTNPYTGESFGDAMVYDRGPAVAADGGSAGPVDEDSADADDDERLEDIDHTPPVEGANRVHERGGEYEDEETDESV